MTWKVLFLLMIVNALYLIMGGAVFNHLEKNEEDINREFIKKQVDTFLVEHDCINHTELNQLLAFVVGAYKQGVVIGDNASSVTHWSLPRSIFFSGTVVTTIGYGVLAPSSAGGRGFCGLYALCGIPVMMVMLAGIGQKLRSGTDQLQNKILTTSCERRPKLRKAMDCAFIFGVGAVLFFLIPSLIFKELEGWSFSAAFYFTIITLTTIGFGDYVAGTDAVKSGYGSLYSILLCLWIIIGLAWLAGVLATAQDFISCFISKAEETIQTKRAFPGSSKRARPLAETLEREVTPAKRVIVESSRM